MPATTAKTIPYPVPADNNNVPADIQALADWLNTMLGPFTSAQITAFAAGLRWVGRIVFNSDTKELWMWDGSIWQVVGYVRGEVKEYAGGTVPNGWLLCDGSAVSRTTYADLFNAIGTKYGAGNGSTTFNLPDRRKRVGVGASTDGDTAYNDRGRTGGATSVTLAITNLPAHAHTMSHGHTATSGLQSSNHTHSGTTDVDSPDHTHSTADGLPIVTVGGPTLIDAHDGGTSWGYQTYTTSTTTGASVRHQHNFGTGGVSADHNHAITVNNFTGDTTSVGSNTAFSTLDPYVTFNYIIKF